MANGDELDAIGLASWRNHIGAAEAHGASEGAFHSRNDGGPVALAKRHGVAGDAGVGRPREQRHEIFGVLG